MKAPIYKTPDHEYILWAPEHQSERYVIEREWGNRFNFAASTRTLHEAEEWLRQRGYSPDVLATGFEPLRIKP